MSVWSGKRKEMDISFGPLGPLLDRLRLRRQGLRQGLGLRRQGLRFPLQTEMSPFRHFWSKKSCIFARFLHYFLTWCHLVTFCPKNDAPGLCFPVSNRLCQKWKFPIFAKSIWDRKRLLNLMIFRTKNHKIPTSAKVVCSLSFFRCFGGYFGTFGHMSIWDRKRLLKCNLFGTTWALRNAQTVVFLVKNRWKRQCFTLLLDLGPLCPFWFKKPSILAIFSCLKSTCAKMEISLPRNVQIP